MKRLPSKAQLAAKLLEYPMLRLLLYERWFRVAFAGLVLLFAFLALFLPKIWRASEPGFRPVIKVSGLDIVQAWSLKRTALKAAAAGKHDEAGYAWQSALANNQADPELVRGALSNILKDPRRGQKPNYAVQESFWLLKLTGTNIADLELAAKVLEKFNYYDAILPLVDARKDQLTPGLAAVYLRGLFNDGRMAAFNARWVELEDKVKDNPELRLYRAAHLTGWGPPDTITEARRQLESATEQPALRVLAYRLKLAVSAHELKATEYGEALKKLEDWREDTLAYHAGYWRLLHFAGRDEEAKRLAQGYSSPPSSPMELAELVQCYSDLGLRDQSLELLERHGNLYSNSAVYWITYANELAEAKRWDDLRKLAVQIRGQDGMRDQLGGFSYFIEGRAETALGRASNAAAAFSKAAEREFPYPSLGQKVASQLLQLGQPAAARQILEGLEKALLEDPNYWFLMFGVADQLKDVDLLVKSAGRSYALQPGNPVAINNYAASLIISRQNPQEVIKLTLQLFAQNPNSLHAVVNHSAALLLNDRPKEAEALLSRVRTNGLNRAQLALYNLDLFETYLGLGDYDQAWSISDRIETERLYPSQRQWLNSKREKLPPRQKPG